MIDDEMMSEMTTVLDGNDCDRNPWIPIAGSPVPDLFSIVVDDVSRSSEGTLGWCVVVRCKAKVKQLHLHLAFLAPAFPPVTPSL
jgi:hypothetical protein